MPIIKLLSDDISNRIAAGEVVERPASIVKELVENSLDAGATRIEVNLTEGGQQLIEVIDNGCGMDDEDLVLCVQRFATSKINSAEDLDHILTMGFRGEALPSIAAVSHLRITTRLHDASVGHTLTCDGGENMEVREVGCPPGTTTRVAGIFYNTPARMKFLSTTSTERGHCQEWVSRLALARPDVAFKLTHNGTVLFTAAGAGDMRSVLAAIYGAGSARDFLPISLASRGLTISGYISGPRLVRSTRQHQLFFINRRFVRSRMLSAALSEAYGMLLPGGRNPLCAILIEIEPTAIDPNVHPTKIEVRFRSQGEVFNLVQQTVSEALAQAGYRSLTQASRRPDHGPRDLLPAGRIGLADEEQRGRIRRLRLNPLADVLDEHDAGLGVHDAAPLSAEADAEQRIEQSPDMAALGIQVLGQHASRYIVAQLGEDLILIDQHRAAERVAYEKLTSAEGHLVRQLLVIPITLEISPTELAAAQTHREALDALGFATESFGGAAVLVRSVPAVMAQRNVEQVLRGIIEALAEHGAKPMERGKLLATVACHGAIKAGERMSAPEMSGLVSELLKTQAPAVCPHGDPIILTLDGAFLDRKFHRH